jgi:poly-beta-1,6-N-acetyl-D-glucosamine synthase
MIRSDNILLLVIFIIFCLSVSVQLFYWLWFYLAPHFYVPVENKNVKEPVSVIICSRNEAESLEKNLPVILKQDYPSYEVIVVNDCSEDSTDMVLGKLLAEYPHLRVSSINKDPKFTHNKKFAQFIGIKAAANEILVFTDADCVPGSDKWLLNISTTFEKNIDVVLGYGGYISSPGLLNRFIRFDTMFIAMKYAGMALRGFPYMGVGRNLAYRRSLFFKNKGFGSYNNAIPGDDDLFINSVASKSNTRVELREESHTKATPVTDFSEYLKQKKRYSTSAKFYKPLHKFMLFAEPFSRIIFYAGFITIVSSLYLWQISLALFGVRLITQLIVVSFAQKRFNEKGILFHSLIFDIFSPFINGILYFGGYRISSKGNLWK